MICMGEIFEVDKILQDISISDPQLEQWSQLPDQSPLTELCLYLHPEF